MIRSMVPNRASLAEQVGEELLAAILDGEYEPGTQLPPEGELAAQAGISRLTVREAVKTLKDKGVVRVEQGRGTFVNPVSTWSSTDPVVLAARSQRGDGALDLAAQLTEARRLVESATASLAAQRHLPADLSRMEQALERMRSANEAGSVEDFADADLTFHSAILAASGNLLLAAIFEPVSTLTRRVRLHTSMDEAGRGAAIAEHQGILEAIASGDGERAQRHMEQHLARTGDEIARWDAGSPGDAGVQPINPDQRRRK